MKKLTFQGYSDDTFACKGPGIDVDYDTCASMKPVHMRVKAADGDLVVSGQYSAPPHHGGGWTLSVAPYDEDVPAWPMRLEPAARPYSPRLVIDAPDDVVVTLMDRDT
jgi:hypothetical protein